MEMADDSKEIDEAVQDLKEISDIFPLYIITFKVNQVNQ